MSQPSSPSHRGFAFSTEDVLRICRDHLMAENSLLVADLEKVSSERDTQILQQLADNHQLGSDIETNDTLRNEIFEKALQKRLFDTSTSIEYF